VISASISKAEVLHASACFLLNSILFFQKNSIFTKNSKNSKLKIIKKIKNY